MDKPKPTLLAGIAKLAEAGQQAGFSVAQMISFLHAGVGVETLIDVISWRLEQPRPRAPLCCSSLSMVGVTILFR